jgi:hypothetical protein
MIGEAANGQYIAAESGNATNILGGDAKSGLAGYPSARQQSHTYLAGIPGNPSSGVVKT